MTDYTAGSIMSVADATKNVQSVDIQPLKGGGYVVSYQEQLSFGFYSAPGPVHSQVYDDAGVKIGTETTIGGSNFNFDGVVAANDGGFLVVWDQNSTTKQVQQYDASGSPVGGVHYTNSVIVGFVDGGFVGERAIYTSGSTLDLLSSIYDSSFNLVGSEIHIDDGAAFYKFYDSFAKLDDGGLVFVFDYTAFGTGGVFGGGGVYLQRFDSSGQKVGSQSTVATETASGYQGRADVAALYGGGFVVTWLGGDTADKVFSQRYDDSGAKIGTQLEVSAGAGLAAAPKVIGLADGGYIIAWDALTGGPGYHASNSIHIQQFDAADHKVGSEISIATTGGLENLVVLDNGSFVVEWNVADYVHNSYKAFQEVFTPVTTAPSQIFGDNHDNALTGDDGNNILWGLGGNDTLIGNGGVDTLYGGKGDDVYYVDNSADVVSEESTGAGINDGGHDLVISSVTYTLGSFIEDLALTGSANLNGIGNTKYNAITGNDGNNTLWGLAGDDTLNGGNGEDTLYGGAGDDTYYLNSAGDVASEESSGVGINDGGHDIVNSSISFTLGTFIEDLTLTGTGDINGTGNENYSNIIIGNSGNNVLSGLSGGDTMSGNDGNDTLDGGVGRDSLDGGNGTDLLLGGSGKDTLIGGAGNDTLNGGIDTDTFVFAAAGAANGVDTVQDFVHGVDSLQFAIADYGAAPAFTAGTAAVGTSAQFIWDAITHTLYFDDDGTGSHAAIAIATFNANATLTASDLHFV